MTAGKSTDAASGHSTNLTSRQWFQHSTAPRVNTDAVVVQSLRQEYPNLHLTVVPQSNANIQSFVAAGHASLAPIDTEKDRLSWTQFVPPASRVDGPRGFIGRDVRLGKFLLDWEGKEYVLVVADGRDGAGAYPDVRNQYLLSASVENTNRLVFEVGVFTSTLSGEFWVFDGGFWQKSKELFDSVQKSYWKDVILDEGMKEALRGDVEHFFDSKETYADLKVAWKRGVIFYGPPGNGKTISLKALMNSLYRRDPSVPTLYVKTLSSFAGPEYSINQIFSLARREAPCILAFEDLDSIVTDQIRSFFLNAVDGILKNDGIFMIGSTNHIERLDPGISKRPSRFDRKWKFPNPNEEERTKYMKYWQAKLADNDLVEFPDKLCPAVAKITKDFSFAYLQEAMVASLLVIARDSPSRDATCLECLDVHEKTGASCEKAEGKRVFKGLYDWVSLVARTDKEDEDLDSYILWRELKKQIRILREEL